ncbi:hypothetical protein A2926_01430 [Candidatus Giovannonibacteria bacterium RIFCSPLOWO2_01_FULL_44_40]|uniref:Uncharacterized protein n=1 Tax=Candidatus Giovannonibacteria bacterium RIFCSPHIGHO2_01_FULL_45_23 TaxID=1798325 RepID=A0A1F5VF13_9BACT|nr:MAG: hypothetical protein A2834_01620 [Candidatus Giovannonibacteria bacterium RIFCSPHIGHO2_01_FULL_45_23]OGF75348.1 MAG: hypothetical protein A3C77_00420 [Candidatus Giovannonibacteria bacterium RIFCSPHIGHO2_02_FULL_45_13]OGF79657.1 MAG: hypothetical protein A2926_01430 [Candidatus Giovannonibacteria bacterium RIFCSPLOWO2_01_FULL_44_40]
MPEDKWEERIKKIEHAKDDPLMLPMEIPLKDWQKEFQEEFCQSCIHYSASKDCKLHWTDYIGQCHNFRWNS